MILKSKRFIYSCIYLLIFVERLKTKFRPYADEILDGLRDISKGSKSSAEEMNNLFNSFLYCLQPAIRSKIQVYSLDDDHDLDDTIFEAIIQGKLNSFIN